MKKILSFLLLTLVVLIPFGFKANAYSSIPNHLYGNDKIELAYYQQGVGVYVDKTSIINEYYNPPYYKLAANIIYYDFNRNKELHIETSHYSYNTNSGAIYVDSNWRGKRGPFFNNVNTSNNKKELKVAKIIWKTIYHMNWKW